ncbi:radical SAM/SPASM domain-containing protein [Alkaliphilus transvaalensis]|uniref:radical SAM/SPASM domain-containing protein n=1 Tax=Alkaliphilus transvaalensis TaxID=114628 RepID=UPI00068640D9|nr:radical SAM protein [Alkaliphilus transvaalensis]
MKSKLSKYNINVPFGDNTFIFNTLSKGLIRLNNSLLSDIENNREVDSYIQKEMERMNFIVNNEDCEKQIMRYLMNSAKYNYSAMGIILSLTSNCNFRCSYCYQDGEDKLSSKFLSIEEWKILLGYIKKTIRKNHISNLSISLFGGEPLLDYDALIKIVKEIKALEEEEEIKVSIVLITNGSLLTKSRIDELLNYVSAFQITLDGSESTHNKLRPYLNGGGSFKNIFSNISYLTNQAPNRLNLRVNVAEESISSVYELLKILIDEKISSSLAGISFEAIFSTQDEILSIGHENRVSTQLLKEINKLYFYAVKKGFKINKNFIFGPCMIRHVQSFVVDENLNVYSCAGKVYQEQLGRVEDNSNLSIIDSKWYSDILEEPSCIENCQYAPICYGGCRWMSKCNKEFFDAVIKERIAAYVISKYPEEVEHFRFQEEGLDEVATSREFD